VACEDALLLCTEAGRRTLIAADISTGGAHLRMFVLLTFVFAILSR
jgi:hypothetical protein